MKKIGVFVFLLVGSIFFVSCKQSPKQQEQATKAFPFVLGRPIYLSELVSKYGSETEAFNKAIAQDKVVVDFYADWCGPCKRLASIIDELAREMRDVLFLKVDVSNYSIVSDRQGIKSIPVLAYFKNGRKIAQTVGLKSKNEIRSSINRLR